MKIRLGYVSNSSSSSFCIMGITESSLLEKNPKLAEAFDNGEYEDIEECLGINWINDEITVENGIAQYYDDKVIGLDVEKMNDNETLLDFKNRVLNFFKNKNLNIDIEDINWRVDGGMNN